MALFNLARMAVSSSGTGDITLAGAVTGFLTFDAAGCSTATTGQAITYAISDTAQSEIGTATYYSSANAVKARAPDNSTNSNLAINMSNSAQVMITPRAADFTTQISIGSPAANLMLNGAMEVSQEKGTTTTTQTGATFNAYVIDQVKPNVSQATMRLAWTKSATAGLAGFPICLQAQASTGFNGAFAVAEVVEPFVFPLEGTRMSVLGFGAAAPQTVYIGFKVYATLTGTLALTLQNAAANRSYVVDVPVTAATTWQWCTVAIPGDATGAWPATTALWGNVIIASKGGTNTIGGANAWTGSNIVSSASTTNFFASNGNIVDVTSVIISAFALPTSAATRTMFRPFEEELTQCKLFYEKSYLYAVAPATVTNVGEVSWFIDGFTNITHNFVATVPYLPKRIAPAITHYSPVTGASGKARDGAANADITPTGVTPAENSYTAVYSQTAVATSINFSWHWVADARL